MSDPYLYPGTTTLINNFGIKNTQNLQELESAHYHIKLQQEIPLGKFDYVYLKAIHKHLFGDVYHWAGQERTVDIAKGNSYFCHVQFINKELVKIFEKLKGEEFLKHLDKTVFCENLAHYFNEINAIHPFREGNGRTLRLFCQNLAEHAGYNLAWQVADKEEYLQASIAGFQTDDKPMFNLLDKLVSPFHQQVFLSEKNIESLTPYEALLLSQSSAAPPSKMTLQEKQKQRSCRRKKT